MSGNKSGKGIKKKISVKHDKDGGKEEENERQMEVGKMNN